MSDLQWRQVAGWNYEVSSTGNVRRIGAGCALKPKVDKRGYANVILSAGTKRRYACIHRLVCETFYGQPPFSGAHVRHLDGNARNNAVSNLRWGTAKQNSADRALHGRHAKGADSPRAKLTQEQVRAIRTAYGDRKDRRAPNGLALSLARTFGVSEVTVRKVAAGRGYAEASQ